MSTRFQWCSSVLSVLVLLTAAHAHAGPPPNPQPVGTSLTTVGYDTLAGQETFNQSLGYDGPGSGLADIQHIGTSPNIGGFIAFNTLGRRTAVIPEDPSVQAANETLMRHGFYKTNTSGNNLNKYDDFFAGIDVEGDVTLRIEDITFDRPVQVRQNTFLLHLLWDGVQLDEWGLNQQNEARLNRSNNMHVVNGFRDFSSFFLGGDPVFKSNPDNYIQGTISPTVTHDAPNIIDVELTFPYRLLTHLEDDGLGPPATPPLPAPGDFLEPFHFHLEYLVVPEPGSLTLLAAGVLLVRRRCR